MCPELYLRIYMLRKSRWYRHTVTDEMESDFIAENLRRLRAEEYERLLNKMAEQTDIAIRKMEASELKVCEMCGILSSATRTKERIYFFIQDWICKKDLSHAALDGGGSERKVLCCDCNKLMRRLSTNSRNYFLNKKLIRKIEGVINEKNKLNRAA